MVFKISNMVRVSIFEMWICVCIGKVWATSGSVPENDSCSESGTCVQAGKKAHSMIQSKRHTINVQSAGSDSEEKFPVIGNFAPQSTGGGGNGGYQWNSCNSYCKYFGYPSGSVKGTAPFCNGQCSEDCKNEGECRLMEHPFQYSDFGEACWTGGKVCCCKKAEPIAKTPSPTPAPPTPLQWKCKFGYGGEKIGPTYSSPSIEACQEFFDGRSFVWNTRGACFEVSGYTGSTKTTYKSLRTCRQE